MVRSRDDVLATLRSLKPELVRRFGVREISLFGSFARGDETAASDVDILVDFDPAIGLEFVSLADFLEKALGRRVDLVSTRALRQRHRDAIGPEALVV
jgi:predicted nucleotidyltransferase